MKLIENQGFADNVDKTDRLYWKEIFVMSKIGNELIYRLYKDHL